MSEIDEVVRRLLAVLTEEEQLYVEMKSLLQEERAQMIARDAEKIEFAVRAKEGLAREGKLLEECRHKVMRELGALLGLAEREMTLSIICNALGEEGRELRKIHGRLVSLIAAVRELLEANSNFAGEALSRVQSTMRLLGRLLPDEPTYGRTQKSQVPRAAMKPGRIVRQAV